MRGLARVNIRMSIHHSRRTILSGALHGAALSPALWLTKGAFAQQIVAIPALTIGPYYPKQLPLDLDNDQW